MRPGQLDPAPPTCDRAEPPGVSSPRFAISARSAPSTTPRPRRWPPARPRPTRVSTGVSSPAASGRRAARSRRASGHRARRSRPTYNRRMDGEPKRATAHVPARRPRRRLRRPRRRAPPGRRPPDRAAVWPPSRTRPAFARRWSASVAGTRSRAPAILRRADLRVPLPERAPVRALPAHGRSASEGVRGLRRGPAGARVPPGSGLLQGIGLLLDRLRPRRAKAQSKDGAEPDEARRRPKVRQAEERRRPAGLGAAGQRVADHAARPVRVPDGRRRLRRRLARAHQDHVALSSLGGCRRRSRCPPRRQWTRAAWRGT